MKQLFTFFCIALTAVLTAAEPVARVAVLDFVTPDVVGQEKFLNFESKPIKIGKDCTLNNADRTTMNSVMQGYVRMIDAQDLSATNAANRELQLRDNEFNREKTLKLYQTVVKGEARPMLLGADYLAAELAKHPDAFAAFDGNLMRQAMEKLAKEPDFPQDFLLRLAQETGATHLVYGSIADLHSKLRSYKGYGIETKSVIYELDIIVKVVDLPAQKIIYSKTYTGTLKERDMSTGGVEIDGSKYQTLMKSAMAQAGDDLYDRFNHGRADAFPVTPIPPREDKAAPAAKTPDEVPAPQEEPLPAVKRHETVIIQQNLNTVPGEVPAPPVPVPVAADGNATVIVNAGAVNRPVIAIPQDAEQE